ncbi:uncharacterized protein VTP21DRAFT_8746 [Calcarisporiella thermophila]|uniref:uncharacterized protein n=1 Tax=Calcarisporiella thermophila TaxID=911321 RepID=UPI0037443608
MRNLNITNKQPVKAMQLQNEPSHPMAYDTLHSKDTSYDAARKLIISQRECWTISPPASDTSSARTFSRSPTIVSEQTDSEEKWISPTHMGRKKAIVPSSSSSSTSSIASCSSGTSEDTQLDSSQDEMGEKWLSSKQRGKPDILLEGRVRGEHMGKRGGLDRPKGARTWGTSGVDDVDLANQKGAQREKEEHMGVKVLPPTPSLSPPSTISPTPTGSTLSISELVPPDTASRLTIAGSASVISPCSVKLSTLETKSSCTLAEPAPTSSSVDPLTSTVSSTVLSPPSLLRMVPKGAYLRGTRVRYCGRRSCGCVAALAEREYTYDIPMNKESTHIDPYHLVAQLRLEPSGVEGVKRGRRSKYGERAELGPNRQISSLAKTHNPPYVMEEQMQAKDRLPEHPTQEPTHPRTPAKEQVGRYFFATGFLFPLAWWVGSFYMGIPKSLATAQHFKWRRYNRILSAISILLLIALGIVLIILHPEYFGPRWLSQVQVGRD